MSIIGSSQSGVLAVDAALAEVLEDVGRAELRNPRVVKQVDVVLPGLVLRIREPLLERDAVLVLEELDVVARVGLRAG